MRGALSALGARGPGAENRNLEGAPIAIIGPLSHQRQPGLAIRPRNTQRRRTAADAVASVHARASFMAGRVGRPSGLPVFFGDRFASPAVGPATLVWRRSGEPPATPKRPSCQATKAGTAPRLTHLHPNHPPTRPRHPTQVRSPKTAPT